MQEWEEKLSRAVKETEQYKQKYVALQNTSGSAFMEEARNGVDRIVRGPTDDEYPVGNYPSLNSNGQRSAPRGAESIASLSSMAQHARTLVGQFNCTGLNERSMGPIHDSEMAEGRGVLHQQYGGVAAEWRDRRSNDAAKKAFAARNPGGYSTRVVDV